MKLLVVLSACVLLAVGQIDAKPFNRRPRESFAALVANSTAEMLSRDENPTTLATLAYKSSSMFLASFRLHMQLPAQHLITDVTYTATRFLTPDRALADIKELQKIVLRSINDLDNQRPAEASDEVNKLIDDFVNASTESATQVFENMHALAVRETEAVEPTSVNLIALTDELVQKIDSCQNIQPFDFRQYFQCNRDYHEVANRITPELATLRNAADKLYSDYSQEWNAYMSEFESKMEELKHQIWN